MRPIPVTILISISIITSVAAGIVVAQSGILNLNDNKPLINGTILNFDNKSYNILITPFNATVPTPQPIPSPAPIENDPPHIEVSSPIDAVVDQSIEIFAEVSDADGNVTNIIWNQESGEVANFTSNGSRLQFVPTQADTYVFSIEAQDNDNATSLTSITVIAKVSTTPIPPITPPQPVPAPTPNATEFKYIAVGDIHDTSSGKLVFNQVKASNPDLVYGLGDLNTYDSDDGTWFLSSYGSLGNILLCQLGNHDENKPKIEKYCGENANYMKKLGKFLIFGINTEGNLTKQATEITTLLKNPSFMTGITDVFFNSHKFYATPPNNSHKTESDVKAMYDKINAAVPATVQDEYYVAAHNHFMAHGIINGDDHFISGAGGRDHYQCETTTTWTFCNDSSYGFLEFILKTDGSVKAQFIDYNGKVLK